MEQPPEVKAQKRLRVGRPTKLTPEIVDRICLAVRAGNYIETSAAWAGVSKVTLYSWFKRGRAAPRGAYGAFLNALEKALADAETSMVAVVTRAAQGQPAQLNAEGQVIVPPIPQDWKAGAWRLERMFPGRWGRRLHVTQDEDTLRNPNEQKEEYIADWGGPLEPDDDEPVTTLPALPPPENGNGYNGSGQNGSGGANGDGTE